MKAYQPIWLKIGCHDNVLGKRGPDRQIYDTQLDTYNLVKNRKKNLIARKVCREG